MQRILMCLASVVQILLVLGGSAVVAQAQDTADKVYRSDPDISLTFTDGPEDIWELGRPAAVEP